MKMFLHCCGKSFLLTGPAVDTLSSVRLLIFWSILSLTLQSVAQEVHDLDGNMESLFSRGIRHNVPMLQGFPSAQEFYTSYAMHSKPVLFKSGAKQFPAFKEWNDEYFLLYPESEEEMVTVEREKKENRSLPAEEMSFADFVRSYRKEDMYMVNALPDFLKEDVLIPPCIACPDVIKGNLIHNILWFSSGGTKSVLHTDSAENILCLIRGNKEFFLVDKKYGEQVNVTERGYSNVDVDRVNLTIYPGLHQLEHYYAAMEPGDCLYVPFLWVHHVRSYNENVAVNLWWKENLQVDFSTCDTNPVNFKGLQFIGFGGLYESQYQMIKNRLSFRIKKHGDLSVDSLMEVFGEPDIFGPDLEWTEEMTDILKQIITQMDLSPRDDQVGLEELENLQNKDWEHIRNLINDLSVLVFGEENVEGEEEESNLGPAEKTDLHHTEL